MEEHEHHALETLRNLTLQLILVAAGVFGIVGGFISTSGKDFQSAWALMTALICFAISGFCGYMVHGMIIGMLNEKKRFDPRNRVVQAVTLAQAGLFAVGSLLFIVFVFFNIGVANAQGLEEALGNPYVESANKIFDRWDSGDISVSTVELKSEFLAGIARRSAEPMYDFERDPSFQETMESRFDALGPSIDAELPLSAGARLMLSGAVLDRSEQLAEEIKEPENLFGSFGTSFLIALGASQQIAMSEDREQIGARAITQMMGQWHSQIYPICCWDSDR